ncbi:hypothetical protein ACLIKD_00715 [Azonexus sp. IMCC34842]|uniref:hypothetical protein n=1 Tax=Azonexus sp. IMCC34842 TaxID=3420950 RepID=UPI003D131677
MSDDAGFEYITTNAAVETYTSSAPIFEGLLKEVRELSKKKPEATMSAGKVKLINRVLTDLLTILKDEPAGKYLDELDDDALPQMSDAVLTMVQFETALTSFRVRYRKYVYNEYYWITSEQLAAWNEIDEEE